MQNVDKKNGHMTIEGLADSCDVSVSTVLYYQRLGLLPEPPKPKHGGFRVYDESHIVRLRQIRNAQTYGFTLKGIGSILYHLENENCAPVKSLIAERLKAIQSNIRTLKGSQKSLNSLDDCCNGKCCNGGCLILQKLSCQNSG